MLASFFLLLGIASAQFEEAAPPIRMEKIDKDMRDHCEDAMLVL
jgi:hypothetical protein